MSIFFNILTFCDEFFWAYIAFLLIMGVGLYFTIKTKFFQIRALPQIIRTFFQFFAYQSKDQRGVHPLKAFFASVGGMIGVGNVVGVITAVQLGGPGALLWIWIAGLVGCIVKYCEIYLGFKFREENKQGGFDGGPMYYLKKAFKIRTLSIVVAALLCVYGIEIYQFSVITKGISTSWNLNHFAVVLIFLGLILISVKGGVKRIGKICSLLMPFFLITYLFLSLWIISLNISILPEVLKMVFSSAFTGHAAIGGFAGSSIILAVQHGMARAAYSSDLGIGYDSIIQSESGTTFPEKQARLAILGVFIDNIICTLSILLVLVSGVWHYAPEEGKYLIHIALSKYFPFMEFFVPLFLAITGYTTIIAYFVVGLKCAKYLAPRWGRTFYFGYAIFALIFFSYMPQNRALLVMSVSGSLLLIINLLGIFRLRNEINFDAAESLMPMQLKANN